MAARPPKPPELTSKNNEKEEDENLTLPINLNQHKNNFIDNNPSTSSLLKENIPYQEQQKQQNRCIKITKKNDCPCTNISIMHLFHEMKQKFPTVPDNIVNQCVISNCHDRDNCIRSLQNELNLFSTTSQSYPSNALRGQQSNINNVQTTPTQPLHQQNCNITNEIILPNDNHPQPLSNNNFYNSNKLLKPTRPAPVPQINLKNTNCDVTKNNFNIKQSVQKKPLAPVINHPNQQQKQQQISNVCTDLIKSVVENKINVVPSSPPQRPTTLKFRETTSHDNQFHHNHNAQESATNKSNNVQLKPVRKAPAPPVTIISPSGDNVTPLSSSSSSQHGVTTPTPTSISQKNYSNQQNFPNFDHSYSSSIQSPFSDSTESEISLNISLSPTSERSRMPTVSTTTTGQHAQPQTPRRTTSITLQPEPPYTRDFMVQDSNPLSPPSQRSYTSLNLTLRKPSSTPQSPIDITAGPGLTYSSSSFDAGRGLQKSFHISVNAEGGIFRASSIRPKSFYMPPIPHPEEEFRNIEPPSVLRPALSEQNFYKNIMDNTCDKYNQKIVLDSPLKGKRGSDVHLQLVERQKVRKEQLIKAIEKNRKKLHQVQEEIHILKSPELPGESERLDNDIEILRSNCEHLFNEIENSKRLAGQQNLPIVNDSSNSQLRQRPPRPPPPRLTPLQTANNEIMMGSPSSMSPIPSSLLSSNMTAAINVTTPINNINYNTTAATTINNLTDEDGPQWSCKHCTFLNDPLMIRCENCDYDKEIPGTIVNHNFNNYNNSNDFQSSFINNNSNNSNNNNNNNNIGGILNTSMIPPLSTPITTTNTTSTISTNSTAFVDNTSFENNNLPTTAYNCL